MPPFPHKAKTRTKDTTICRNHQTQAPEARNRLFVLGASGNKKKNDYLRFGL
jgi:hypothetical protein